MRRRHFLISLLIATSLTACQPKPSTPHQLPTRTPVPTRAPAPPPTPTATPRFETSAENHYQDPVGSLRFLIDILNRNDYPVEQVRARVVLRDDEGKAITSRTAYARLDLLAAGETASVLVVFFLMSPDFSAHEILVDAREADRLLELVHPALQVVDPTGRVGEWVPYEVLGTVHNTGDSAAESVTLAVTCYDTERRIVAVGTGRAEDRTIPPGGSSDFLVSLGTLAGQVDVCRVQVEGLISRER